jgi:hypothetical protein
MGTADGRHARRQGLRATGWITFLAGLLACASNFRPVPDPVAVRVGAIDTAALEAAVEAVPTGLEARAERLEALFHAAGCSDHVKAELPRDSPRSSVTCELPGRTASIILVGANLDQAHDGAKVEDNWASSALLPFLYKAIAAEPREHTYLFTGFAHPVLRQHGSRQFLRSLGEAGRARIRAMVELKGLGIGTTAFVSTRADANLRQDLLAVSKTLDLPVRETSSITSVSALSKGTRRYHVPTLTVHSLDRKTARVLAGSVLDETPDRSDQGDFLDTARVLAVYLAYLDDTLRIRADQIAAEKTGEYEGP